MGPQSLMPDGVITEHAGLWTCRGAPPPMPHQHRHDDVELNVVRTGALRYLFGGAEVDVGPGQLALFWGTTPHQLQQPGTSEDGDVLWLHIPLTTVLSWSLPPAHLAVLLQPCLLVVDAADLDYDAATAVHRWHGDIERGDHELAFLEVQALVRRTLRQAAHDAPAPHAPEHIDAAILMTRLIAERFRDPLTPAHIAAASHLHPNHAMTVFRRVMGCTIGTYLTRCRISEAQRLLITTRLSTAEIAHAAGFGSQSQFYAHFTRSCSRSPGRYRADTATG
ncbi:helix-turn-helix domain-containing protein [Pseudactinotalea suaedae]|uniref:helix-turn-helix domain-containing protein n=1 Tax=Pseudactinotalea suaedae TaxID=1524924 RepID=UPI0012E1AB57|nr:helix-turn-helix domain-containing protein [Pseudactinotalea suaedae]